MAQKAFILSANTLGLKYADADADLMKDCLSRYGYFVYHAESLKKWQIVEQFEQWIEDCSKVDTCIFYFSGHGTIPRGKLHFVLDDHSDGLDSIYITTLFERCKASNKLIVLDCCHAGATHAEWTPQPSDSYRLLTASGRLERSKELEELHASFLTHHIHRTLESGAQEIADSEGQIRINRLYENLVEHTREHNGQPNGIQVPLPNLLGNQRANFPLAQIQRPHQGTADRDNKNETEFSGGEISPLRLQVYHNLQHTDYEQFIGREEELSRIQQILRPYPHSQHAVVTIDGIGGIGKSALALEVAHYYLQHYDRLPPEERFDAIIWTSAKLSILDTQGIKKRRHGVLKNIDDIYNAIGIALQREDINRADSQNRHEVVRRALSRQRTLVIVDNFETIDDEEVMLFLKELPAPTKAIITTRHRIDVAYPIRLKEMPWEDASILIQQECHKKRVELNDRYLRLLYECAGGVPLAIVWSVGQMGMGAAPERVLRILEEPNDIVRFCFENIIKQIENTSAYILLMTFALCDDSISRECLGHASHLSEYERDDGLMELERLSLINKQADRFSLLPLTKRFILNEFRGYPEKDELKARWIGYFVEHCREYEEGYWEWTNYDWLLAEGTNIRLIVDQALSLDEYDVALFLAYPLVHYLDMTGYEAELKEYGEKLYHVAKIVNHKLLQAWLNVYVFGWYLSPGKEEQAESFTMRGLDIYDDLGDIRGTCFAMIRLGRIYRLKHLYAEAEHIFNQVLKLAEQHDYSSGIADANFGLGNLAIDKKDWKTAKAYFEKIIEWCETQEDREEQVDIAFWQTTCSKLGWVEYCLGNFHRGKELLEESLLSLKQVGGKRNIVKLHLRLAHVEEAIGNCEEAMDHAQQALFWAERLGLQRKRKNAVEFLREIIGKMNEQGNQEDSPLELSQEPAVLNLKEETTMKSEYIEYSLTEPEMTEAEQFRKSQETAILVMMFVDMAQSTQTREEMGEVEFENLRRRKKATLISTIEQEGKGKVIKDLGDGLLGIFALPDAAIKIALQIQEALHGDPSFQVRIGIDMGQVTQESERGIVQDVFGRHVNRAARIEALCEGGHILASYPVWDSSVGWLKHLPDIQWKKQGSYQLKGFAEAQEVYEAYNTELTDPLEMLSGDRVSLQEEWIHCTLCGRYVKLTDSFKCRSCGTEGICAEHCFESSSRECIECSVEKSAPSEPSRSGEREEWLAQENTESSFRIKIWTEKGSTRGSTRDILVAPQREYSQYKLGDKVTAYFQSTSDAYVYMINIGPTGNVSHIFPNEYSTDNFIQGGKKYTFPSEAAGFDWILQEPAGIETIKVIATKVPVDIRRFLDKQDSQAQEWEIAPRTRDIGIRPSSPKVSESLSPAQWAEASCTLLVQK